MPPGTSVLILFTPETAVDAFAKAFKGQGVELIRSDLSLARRARTQGRSCGAPPVPGQPARPAWR
jgi:hypothetical protein